jgi:transcriptional regulator with XRE-family HTH domain
MCAIGTKIRKLRIEHNLSQPELSNLLGISQPTLCNIESGDRKKIDFSLIQKICVVFNKDLSYFSEVPTVFESEKVIVTNKNNDWITYTFNNIADQIQVLIQDNKNKSQIIQELENKLKSGK